MTVEEKDMELMKTLDDAWNSKDWDTFEERHADNVVVFWPGQPEPTRGLHNHREESIQFFKTFPDNHLVNNPYKILFYKDDYTCSVADFTGTFKGIMKGLDGENDSTHQQEISYRVLYRCPTEEQKNRRREIILRFGGNVDPDWRIAYK